MNFPYRYIARISLEAETPLSVGSDSALFDQDAPVQKDWNGLPMIPGTAIAGFLRAKIGDTLSLFGDGADKIKKEDEPNEGSNLIVSDAYLLDCESKVHQGIGLPDNSDFLEKYKYLPIRQHVAIEHTGAAKDGALFDQEFVYKGSRFKFEVTLEVKEECDKEWGEILEALQDNNFYLGAGQFNNFGEMKCISIESKSFDLQKTDQLEAYLGLSVDLNETISDSKIEPLQSKQSSTFTTEEIIFDGSNSFFHFGSGYGDHEVDNANYTEEVVEWETDNKPSFKEYYVIPGTSIKGALAHRTAYHFNLKNNNTVESAIANFENKLKEAWDNKYDLSQYHTPANNLEDLEKQEQSLLKIIETLKKEQLAYADIFDSYTSSKNQAVSALFGRSKDTGKADGKAGSIIIKDMYLPIDTATTVFNHNKIDRFTGGTVDTALFNERVLYIPEFTLLIKGLKEAIENEHFQAALNDLKNGMLPIGGLVNKGHGIVKEKQTNGN